MKYTKTELKNKSKEELIKIILKQQNKIHESFTYFQNRIIADGTKGMQRGI